MHLDKKVSVVIPSYNSECYIERCFDSVQNQTYRNLEILTTDDGSADTSPQYLDEYALISNKTIVIHKSNEGLSEARNDGISLASGVMVAFLDSDDYILPKMYEDMVLCKNDTKADIIVCQWQWESNDGSWTVDHKSLASDIYGKKSGTEFEKLILRGGTTMELHVRRGINCTL